MTVRLSNMVLEVNAKRNVHRVKLVEVKTRYQWLYRQATLQMYRSGIMSDPGYWQDTKIIEALSDFGIGFISRSGRVDFTEERVLYELYKAKFKSGDYSREPVNPLEQTTNYRNWTKFGEVGLIRQVYSAMRLRNILKNIDDLYEELQFDRLLLKKISPKLKYISGRVDSRDKPTLEGIAKVLAGKFELKYGNYKDKQWSLLADIGAYSTLPDDGTPGYFLNDISQEQEKDLYKLINEYRVPMYGRGSEDVDAWYRSTAWSGGQTYEGYLDTRLVEVHEPSSSLGRYIKDIIGEEGRLLTINDEGFYYVDGELASTKLKELHVGQYCVDVGVEGGEVLSHETIMRGACGEFVQRGIEYISEEEYGERMIVRGCPVNIYKNGEFQEYYDLEQVENGLLINRGKTWFDTVNGVVGEANNQEEIAVRMRMGGVGNKLKLQYLNSDSGLYGSERVLISDEDLEKEYEKLTKELTSDY